MSNKLITSKNSDNAATKTCVNEMFNKRSRKLPWYNWNMPCIITHYFWSRFPAEPSTVLSVNWNRNLTEKPARKPTRKSKTDNTAPLHKRLCVFVAVREREWRSDNSGPRIRDTGYPGIVSGPVRDSLKMPVGSGNPQSPAPEREWRSELTPPQWIQNQTVPLNNKLRNHWWLIK